ncbi:MAG: proline--tRNA ligase [Clostridia bacterium]|nr:proline--tRNA ligase [Clostridia bacterium]
MLISKLVGERKKETPQDTQAVSHALLVRAGYIKLVSNGIFTLAMPAKRVAKKIENIIREEMDKLDGQEVQFPVVMPRELWDESGRYSSIGPELVRFKDRTEHDMVLGMTHEEASVHFVKGNIHSYQQLPFMIYQIQTKFRDEARARCGLIRVKEFTMKDAYSFHNTQEDLAEYYEKMHVAYERIFKRIGMKNFVSVKSDSGMMGGSISHEFMLLTDIGEDSIVLCDKCGYKTNMEVATCKRDSLRDEVSEELKTVFTADKKDIDSVCEFLNSKQEKSVKAVCFFEKGTENLVICFIRGDLEVNESKLTKIIQTGVVPANLKDSDKLVPGNIGCYNLDVKGAKIIYDCSLEHLNNCVTGANKEEYHITGLDFDRDMKGITFNDISKVKVGEKCPCCENKLRVENGIEIGNIFQLGTKYTKSMNMTILDKEGKQFNPIMGCYGIGVGRAIASLIEESHDENGMIFPMTVAPWHVYLCPIRLDNEEVNKVSYELYEKMKKENIEVIFDDRDISPGIKFKDQELMGIPLRVVVSPRSLANGAVELTSRDKSIQENVAIDDIVSTVQKIIEGKIKELNTF